MAQVDQSSPMSDSQSVGNNEISVSKNDETESKGCDSKPEFEMLEVRDYLSKLALNPLAKEFFPSNFSPLAKEFFPSSHHGNRMAINGFYQNTGNGGYKWRTNLTQGRQRLSGRVNRAQQEDRIRRTVYVSEVDCYVSEVELASVFSSKCGDVVDCRICGDAPSQLRFAFVEFTDEQGAKEALELCGTVVGLYAIKVLPSKTAILPVNPIYLPRSEDEIAMVGRTIYCTNIDRMISEADVLLFFESYCGKVTRLRLLGDHVNSTCKAFIEFAMDASAITALSLSGMILGNRPIRVSPSKTPVRARSPHYDQE